MSRSQSSDRAVARSAPRWSRWATLVPVAVTVMTLGVIGVTAWPTLRPTRVVEVTQAVFARSSIANAVASEVSSEGGGRTAPSTGGTTVQAPGWLEPYPFVIACSALADGIVASMEVLEGDRVEKDQVVARLVAEDSELRLARADAELLAAQAEVRAATAELAAAQTDWDEPVTEERAVRVSSASLAESRAELAQLPLIIESATATLIGLDEELARAEASLRVRAANELVIIVARQRAASQRATVASLEARRPLLEARIARLQAELHAAERRFELRVAERRRLEVARASLERARASERRAETARAEAALELERMVIRSPIDGYVQRRLKAPGDKVMRMMDEIHSTHLVHLYEPGKIQVRVDVPLADAAHVFVGQRCEVIVEILPDEVFAGEVLRVTHEADLQKNTLQVKVRVDEPSPLLRPEMLTRVKFLASGARGAPSGAARAPESSVLVPIDALHGNGDGAWVWTVAERRGDRGHARVASVRVLAEADGWARVSGPLQAGALLVVGGGDSIRENETVTFRATGDRSSSDEGGAA